MTKFNYCGIPVEVSDKTQAEKLEKILAMETYTQRGLELAATGLMAALQQELKTCTDVGERPTKFEVVGNLVCAKMSPDRRRDQDGVNIGNR
jgi:hypothetical protein